MATYFTFLDFTDQRNRNISASVELAEGLKGIAEKAGIGIIGTYWTIGFHDLVIIFDAPDEEAMSIMLFGLNALNNVRSQIVQGFSVEEMGRILEKLQ